MTKKLQELLDLPDNENDDKELVEPTTEEIDTSLLTTETLSNLEKIENALPQVKGLEAADSELDELASLATSSYKDLMDLGMQVDSRYSSEILAVASTFLGHGITAKTAKINKKLRQIDLMLKKASLDARQASKDKEIENTPIGTGQALDRNELLKAIASKKGDNS